jgi:hypothetical protein
MRFYKASLTQHFNVVEMTTIEETTAAFQYIFLNSESTEQLRIDEDGDMFTIHFSDGGIGYIRIPCVKKGDMLVLTDGIVKHYSRINFDNRYNIDITVIR